MSIVRWDAEMATAPVDPMALDEVDGAVLVLEGVTVRHDEALSWVRRAPCVVIGIAPDGAPASTAVDVALDGADGRLGDDVVERVGANPLAARVLVDVLRTTSSLDVAGALVVESLAYSTLLAGPEHQGWLAARPGAKGRTFTTPPVRVERDGGLLHVTLDRAENRNAFSAAMRDALFEALVLAEVDGTVERVLLDGDGPSFSSGGDLTEFGTAPDVVRAHQVRTRRSVGLQLHRLGSRAVVHVHGACVGAGVELPAFAAHVRAARSSTFRLPEVAMGLIPGAGGTVSISRRIGRQQTALLGLLGDPIGADEALRIGLVDELVESS